MTTDYDRSPYEQMETKMNKNEAMKTLREKGVAKVVLQFSGGNDEGGVDTIRATSATGEEVALEGSRAYQSSKFDPDKKKWVQTGWQVGWGDNARKATVEEVRVAELAKFLEEPIYDRFGSFAGEFSVYGELTWDVETGESTMTGQESYTEWQDL